MAGKVRRKNWKKYKREKKHRNNNKRQSKKRKERERTKQFLVEQKMLSQEEFRRALFVCVKVCSL